MLLQRLSRLGPDLGIGHPSVGAPMDIVRLDVLRLLVSAHRNDALVDVDARSRRKILQEFQHAVRSKIRFGQHIFKRFRVSNKLDRFQLFAFLEAYLDVKRIRIALATIDKK